MKIPLSHLPDANDHNPLVLYHAYRGDQASHGFASALSAWLFFGGRGDYLAMEHGDPLPMVDGRSVYVLDFSISVEMLMEIDRRAARVVLLDHHQSSAPRYDALTLRRGMIHLDFGKSGVRLAWEYFHADASMPAMLRFIEDRDLLRWRYPETPGFIAHLDVEPKSFARWASIMKMSVRETNDYALLGEAMHSKFLSLAQEIAQQSKPVVMAGEIGQMTCAPVVFHDAVGEILSRRSQSYGLVWALVDDGIKVRLRSSCGYNTLPLAQSMGGGGREESSSFRLAILDLPRLVAGQLGADSLVPVPGLQPGMTAGPDAQANRSVFHGLWAASVFSPRYEKAAWRAVHRQLVDARLID